MSGEKDLEQQKKEAAAKAKAAAAAKAKAVAMKTKEDSTEGTSDDLAKAKAAAAAKAKAAALKAKETAGEGTPEDLAKAKAAAAAKAKAAALKAKETAGEGTPEDLAKAKAAAVAKAKAAAAAKAKAAATAGGDGDSEKAKAIAAAKAKAAAAAKAKASAGGNEEKKEAVEEKKPSANQPYLDKYKKVIEEHLGENVLEDSYINSLSKDVPTIVVKKDFYYKVAEFLKYNEQLSFDYLSEIHGTDYVTYMEVYAYLYSYKNQQSIALKVKIDRDAPVIDSITPLWAGANWPECEAYDLLGIKFTGHPNLHRIMLGEDWVGYPLRKDYEQYDVEV